MDELRVVGCYLLPPFVVAEKKGFYAREQLKVTFDFATTAREHNRGMLEGRWDISLTSPHTMFVKATRNGHDFVSYMMAEGGLAIKLAGVKGLKSPSEFRGRWPAGRWAPLIGPRVVGGVYNLFGRRRTDVSVYATTACWARRAWVAENRDKMLRFVRAFVAGTDWVLKPENREETLRLLQDYQKISRKQAELRLAQVTPKAAIVPEDLNRVVQHRIETGAYDRPYVPVERFYDASIWAEATGLARPAPFGMPRPA